MILYGIIIYEQSLKVAAFFGSIIFGVGTRYQHHFFVKKDKEESQVYNNYDEIIIKGVISLSYSNDILNLLKTTLIKLPAVSGFAAYLRLKKQKIKKRHPKISPILKFICFG